MMCSERSGSNLMTRLMNGHSEVTGPSPSHIFLILTENRSRYGSLENDENWKNLLNDTVALLNTNIGDWITCFTVDQLDEIVKERTLGELLSTIYRTEAEAQGKRYVFIKENHVYRFHSFIAANFDNPKFVYLVRDPRDMALSWKKAANLRGCVVRAAETWKNDQNYGLMLAHTLLLIHRIHIIRYEDLVHDTESVLRRLCDYLGIMFEPSMIELEMNEDNRTYSEKNPDWKNVAKPVMKENFNKFINQLSEDEIRYIETLCFDEMRAFDYVPTSEDCVQDHLRIEAMDELRNKLLPFELHDKPGYMKQAETVRIRYARRIAVLEKIKSRPYQRL